MNDIVRKFIEPQEEEVYYTDLSFTELLKSLHIEHVEYYKSYNKDDLFTYVNIRNVDNVESLGLLNGYELYDLRIQIKDNYRNNSSLAGFSGYFLIYDNLLITINIQGRFSNNPKSLFDFIDGCLFKLV